MELKFESSKKENYLKEVPPVIEFHSPVIRKTIQIISTKAGSKEEQARLAFEIARDEIVHNFDSKSDHVFVNAVDVLKNKEGICFAKSHLLASLLRGLGIPTGFCYQKVLKKGDVESGYALHGLNAVYLEDHGWFRIDPRGNKPGVDAQFTIDQEKLAYPIRPELGEVDYEMVFIEPLPSVVSAMNASKNCQQLFDSRPTEI